MESLAISSSSDRHRSKEINRDTVISQSSTGYYCHAGGPIMNPHHRYIYISDEIATTKETTATQEDKPKDLTNGHHFEGDDLFAF